MILGLAHLHELAVHSHFAHATQGTDYGGGPGLCLAWGPPTKLLSRDTSNYKPQRLELGNVFTGSESPRYASS